MKKLFVFILLITSLATIGYSQDKFVKNELIVWLEPGVNAYDFASVYSQTIRPKRLLSKRLNIWLFEYSPGKSREQDINTLKSKPGVRYVQNNHYVSFRNAPNDPYYGLQSNLTTIHMPQVWNFSTGGTTATGKEIVIAIIEAGFDLQHVDLNFWKNENEISDNGADDDGNGYPDDYDGWDVVTETDNLPVADHGTHVSGIAAAIGNNSTGISGVNWNCKILPVTISFINPIQEDQVVAAYGYVYEMRSLYNETNGQKGAFIVATNSSFGVDSAYAEDYTAWCSMYDMLGQVGILNCGATTNNSINVDIWGDIPSTCPSEYLITVGNLGYQGHFTGGRSVNSVDLAAPGYGIYSTFPNNHYNTLDGTSMSTPQVTGAVALMYSDATEEFLEAYQNNPAPYALQMKDYLLNGTAENSELKGKIAHGLLDVYGAFIEMPVCREDITISENVTGRDHDYMASHSISATNTISEGSDVHYGATNIIHLRSGFKVISSSHFLADHNGCSPDKGKVVGDQDQGISDGRFVNPGNVPADVNGYTDGNVIIYPNPSKGLINVSFETITRADITIYNLNGKMMYSRSVTGNETTIDITGQPAGIYYLKLVSSDNTVVKKLIVE